MFKSASEWRCDASCNVTVVRWWSVVAMYGDVLRMVDPTPTHSQIVQVLLGKLFVYNFWFQILRNIHIMWTSEKTYIYIYIYRCFSKIGTIKHDISTECSFVHRYCQKGKIQHQSKAPLLPRLFMIFYGWLVVWNMAFIFPFSWECHHPNWRTHIFQRGRSTTNQTVTSTTKSKQRCRAFGIWHLFDGQNVGGTYRKFSKTSGYPRCPQFQYSDPQLLALKLKKDGGEVLLKPPFLYASDDTWVASFYKFFCGHESWHIFQGWRHPRR